MKFAVVGGDKRMAILAAMLCRDGAKVQTYALDKAELPQEVARAGSLQGCLYGANCVILPLPAEKGGYLNAPYAIGAVGMEELVGQCWPGQLLIGGRLSEETAMRAVRAGLTVEDIARRRDFSEINAAVTAECALGILIAESERTLMGSSVLITGWGKLARALAAKLKALDADVTVAARSGGDRASAAANGLEAIDIEDIEGWIDAYPYVVNTVPAPIITDAALCCARPGTLMLELASAPGGFNRELAANIGLKSLAAPGLPGRAAPYAAAALIKDVIYQVIEETED